MDVVNLQHHLDQLRGQLDLLALAYESLQHVLLLHVCLLHAGPRSIKEKEIKKMEDADEGGRKQKNDIETPLLYENY